MLLITQYIYIYMLIRKLAWKGKDEFHELLFVVFKKDESLPLDLPMNDSGHWKNLSSKTFYSILKRRLHQMYGYNIENMNTYVFFSYFFEREYQVSRAYCLAYIW